MKIESVDVKRLRSIEECEITNCGELNVFIGKNNSGKSSILFAINTFFSCIERGNIVTNKPVIGKEIDFFNRKTQVPIDIALTFSLSNDELNTIVNNIIEEVPQRKNFLEDIGSSLMLSIGVSIVNISSSNDYFSFVSNIALKSTKNSHILYNSPEISILKLGMEAAIELRDQFIRTQQESNNLRFLERLERSASEIVGYPDEGSPASNLLRRLIRTSNLVISSELRMKVERIAFESKSIEEFSSKIHAQILKEQEELKGAKQGQNLLNTKVSTFSGNESSIPNYVTSLLKNVSAIKLLYLNEDRKQIGKEEAEQILSLKVERGGDETLRVIQSIVSSLLGVKINAFRSKGATNAELDIDEFLVEVNGSGIREALRLVLDVLFIQPNILLVEEPEIHLHPALEISLMQYLKGISSNIQVFITTHSTNFLDNANMNNVYLVSKLNATHIQNINIDEAESLIPKELGIRLSSLFMFDRLVFVEGTSDENVIRAWANTLGLNFSQANVGFIPMEGARNFMYFAREATLSFLKKRQVKMWFIIDRDERDEKELEKLEKALKEKAFFKVLKKREIENYLVSPLAIIKFLNEKLSMNLTLSVDEISNIIEESAEQLKQFTINKQLAKAICKHIYPNIDWNVNELKEKPGIEKFIAMNEHIIEKLKNLSTQAENIYLQRSEYIDKICNYSGGLKRGKNRMTKQGSLQSGKQGHLLFA